MYVPSHFEEKRPEVLHQLLHDHPFGLLISHGDAGLDATPMPLLFKPVGDGLLHGHIARANPLWRQVREGAEVLVVFQGPQTYVTPSWYATKADTGQVVPTWNYITVQARGRLQVRDDAAWLLRHLTELTERHESPREMPWAVGDAPAAYIDKLLRALVGIEIPLHQLVGKWKVSQNRPAADREGVVRGLRAQGDDSSLAMADWVQRSAP